MTPANGNDPERPRPGSPGPHADREAGDGMTQEEFRRRVELAQERGEPISELVRSFVIATIDEVMRQFDEE